MFRKTNRLQRPLAAGIAVVALAVPATSAAYPNYDHRSADAQDAALDARQQQRGSVDQRSIDAQDAAIDARRGVSRTTLGPTAAPTVQASGSGFDWGDAGIGAGGVLGLVLIGLSGMYAVVHRRHRADGPGGAAATT